MILQSLSVWWKSRRGRNDARVVSGNVRGKSYNRKIIYLEKEEEDQLVAVAIACADVGSIAARSIRRIFEALDGRPDVVRRLNIMYPAMSRFVKGIGEDAVIAARKMAKVAQDCTDTGRLPVIFVDWEPVVVAARNRADAELLTVRRDFDENHEKATPSPYQRHVEKIAERALSDLNEAVVNVIEAHVASILGFTTFSVAPLERLVAAVANAATESMRNVVKTVELMRNDPPPYETPGVPMEGTSQTLSNIADDDKVK